MILLYISDRRIKLYQKLFLLALKNLVIDLYNVMGEGIVIGTVWKTARETFESISPEEEPYEIWNYLSDMSLYSKARNYLLKAPSCRYEITENGKRFYDCEFRGEKAAMPAFCQWHKGSVEGLFRKNVELDNDMIKGGDYCEFRIKGIKPIGKKGRLSRGARYLLTRALYLAPLLGLIKYMKKEFRDYDKYLRKAFLEAGREFASELKIKSPENGIREFMKVIGVAGIKGNALIWGDIYNYLGEKLELEDREETLSMMLSYLLEGFAGHYGKKASGISVRRKDGKILVSGGEMLG